MPPDGLTGMVGWSINEARDGHQSQGDRRAARASGRRVAGGSRRAHRLVPEGRLVPAVGHGRVPRGPRRADVRTRGPAAEGKLREPGRPGDVSDVRRPAGRGSCVRLDAGVGAPTRARSGVRGGAPRARDREGPLIGAAGGADGSRPPAQPRSNYLAEGRPIPRLASSALDSRVVFDPATSDATVPPCSDGIAIRQTSFEYHIVLVWSWPWTFTVMSSFLQSNVPAFTSFLSFDCRIVGLTPPGGASILGGSLTEILVHSFSSFAAA